ncbi:MAG: hypothetical protein ACM30E_12185 [Nitrososphaerales archaeon]
MADIDDLLASIFEDANRALYAEFEKWVRSSRRFRAFATSYRTKIRAKLRNARDAQGMKDLRTELEAAFILLQEERFTLEYEKYAAAKQRGPDFTVTFKTHTLFSVEVRRIRSVELADGPAEGRAMKLVAAICDKVAQMPANMTNLLWISAETEIPETELAAATSAIRQLAEGKVDRFFAYYGYPGASEFLRQYGRLNGVVLRHTGGCVLWLNPLARHKPPHDLDLALRRLLQTDPASD